MFDLEEKSGGLSEMMAALKELERWLTPLQFQVFCSRTPVGEELLKKFRERKSGLSGSEDLQWYYFAAEIVGKYMTPRYCRLPLVKDERMSRVRTALEQINMSSGSDEDHGMSLEDIRNVHRQIGPSLTKMRRALCVNCKYQNCRWSLRLYEAIDVEDDLMHIESPEAFSQASEQYELDMRRPLSSLMNGERQVRDELGQQIVEQILTYRKREELSLQGISCRAFHMSSRKNPKLVFRFSSGNRDERISVQVGNQLVNGESSSDLRLVGDVKRLVDQAIERLAAETGSVP